MLSRTWLSGAALMALVIRPTPDGTASAGPPSPAAWRDAPALARLFAPRETPAGAYRAFTSDLGLEASLQQIHQDASLSSWPGAWTIARVGPVDAFGQGGRYDRWQLARLYAGTPARIARGPRIEDGRVVEAWTLISPYPDAGVGRLEPGTLLLVLQLR